MKVRRVHLVAAALLALSALTAGSLGAAPDARRAAAPDPERNSTVPTGWEWYDGLSETDLNGKAKQNGERIMNISVGSTSPYRFSSVLVNNSGPYARPGATWWFGFDRNGVVKKTADLQSRIVDLEPYTSG